MADYFFTLFDTALGRCGLAWGDAGLVAVSFPEDDDARTIARLTRRAADAVETLPPTAIQRVIDDIVALFNGEPRMFDYVDLDMARIADFDRDVIALTLAVKPGETKTYGDLAKALGDVALSRRVGQALGRNPFPILAPCHRIVGANGLMTGFSAPGGTTTKQRLLKIEGALAPDLFDAL